MNTKHIFIGAMAVAALGMTSCSDDFFDTSSKTTQNTETAYSNLETAEVALVGCYDGWQRTISDVEVGMYLLAEFASEQAFAGLGFADAKTIMCLTSLISVSHRPTMTCSMPTGQSITQAFSVATSCLPTMPQSIGKAMMWHAAVYSERHA